MCYVGMHGVARVCCVCMCESMCVWCVYSECVVCVWIGVHCVNVSVCECECVSVVCGVYVRICVSV